MADSLHHLFKVCKGEIVLECTCRFWCVHFVGGWAPLLPGAGDSLLDNQYNRTYVLNQEISRPIVHNCERLGSGERLYSFSKL